MHVVQLRQQAGFTIALGFVWGGWVGELGGGGLGLVGLDVGFDFGAEAHAAVAVGIRLCVHNSRLAVGFVGLSACDFRGHFDGGLYGHAHLKAGPSDKEKSAAGNVQSFGEVFAFISGKINGSEAQGEAQAIALEMSAFRRGHFVFCACSGEGARADDKSLNPKSITRGGVVKRYEGVRMGYEVRLPARGAVPGCPESAENRDGCPLPSGHPNCSGGDDLHYTEGMASTNPSPDLSGTSIEWKTIEEAHERIRPRIHRTPVMTSESLNAMGGAALFFKCENLQKTGSFKIRGATNAIFSLSDEEASHGVVTHSSGNHAAAVARAAAWRGISPWVLIPNNSPPFNDPARSTHHGTSTHFVPKVSARAETAKRI